MRKKEVFGRHRLRWEDNITMDLRGTGFEGINWTQLTDMRVTWWIILSMVTRLQVP
jgi:hypothetical protein